MSRNNGLSFQIFNVSEHKNDDEFKYIADLFENSKEQLCMHNEKKIVNLHDYFHKEIGFLCDYVYYIKKQNENKSEIIAFAFIKKTKDQNIYTVNILCSHKEKHLYQDEKPGIFLLNTIYDNFVSKEKGVLCIEPATEDLIPYYAKWRTPSYSPFNNEYSKGVSTGGYLLYFEDIDNITDEMLYELVFELKSLRLIKENIASDLELNKEGLKLQIESIEDDGIKQQLKYRLDNIRYFTIEEYRNHIGEFKNKAFQDMNMSTNTTSSGLARAAYQRLSPLVTLRKDDTKQYQVKTIEPGHPTGNYKYKLTNINDSDEKSIVVDEKTLNREYKFLDIGEVQGIIKAGKRKSHKKKKSLKRKSRKARKSHKRRR